MLVKKITLSFEKYNLYVIEIAQSLSLESLNIFKNIIINNYLLNFQQNVLHRFFLRNVINIKRDL